MPIDNFTYEGGDKQRAAGKDRQIPYNENFSPEDATGIKTKINEIINSDKIVSFQVKLAEPVSYGDPLYIASTEIGGVLVAGLADSSNPAKMPCVGFAGATGILNALIQCVESGKLGSIDTTIASSIGESIYVANGGGFTNIKPASNIQHVGFFGRIDSSDGFIVSNISPIQGAPGSVSSVTGNLVDNIDPANPIVSLGNIQQNLYQGGLRANVAPTYDAGSTSDLAYLTREYAQIIFLTTSGSLPTQLVFVSPTGNDLTAQKGNIFAPYTPAGGVDASTSGDTIVWIGGTYSVGTSMYKAGVAHTTFGPVNLTFTAGGSFGASLTVEGNFSITSGEQVFGGNNIGGVISYRIKSFNQTAGIFCNLTGTGYTSIDVMFENGVLSGSAGGIVTPSTGSAKLTGKITSTSTGISVSSNCNANISMTLNNTVNAGFSFISGVNHGGSCILNITQNSTSSCTFGEGSYDGIITGGTLKCNTSNVYCDLSSVIIQQNNNSSYSNIYGKMTSCTVTFNSGASVLYIFSKKITTLTVTNGNNNLVFDGCYGTGINMTAGANTYIIKNSELTLTTGSYLPSAGINCTITQIFNSKIIYNHEFLKEAGRQNGTDCKLINSEIINNSISATSTFVYKSQALQSTGGADNWTIRNSVVRLTAGTEIFGSVDSFYVKVLLEGNNSFSPKLSGLKSIKKGSSFSDSKIRLTATASNVDFTNVYNGLLNVNSTAFGMTITNTEFLLSSTFKYLNTNASTVTITVVAPLNFLNGTTATTKTIAQNEIFEFTNIDGTNIIIK